MFKIYVLIFYFFFLQSCSSFSKKQNLLNKTIIKGKYQEANKILDKNFKSEHKGRNKLLYYMDRGILSYLNNEFEESNKYFNIADEIHENQKINVGDLLLKYTLNPSLTNYLGEDHEIFFIHYYKALNYLALGKNDDALVECRRLNTELEVLSDKYKNKKDFYSKDAFAHTLMGIVYQANYDFNNAFIAYRNAVEIFEDPNYQKNFNIKIPKQLQKDIIFVATKLSDYENVNYYKKKFNLENYDPAKEDKNSGDLICFWNNGVCPKKKNFTITFVIGRIGDLVTFTNTELGLFFAFPIPSEDIFDLQILRIAFPKYEKKFSVIKKGFLKINDTNYELEKLEDINKVALKSLAERMDYELSQMLLRFAIKKTSEILLRKSNEYVGIALGIFNSITEQADTRSWTTLPFEISYSRIKLPEGKYNINLEPIFNGKINYKIAEKFKNKKEEVKEILIKKHQTCFYQVNTLFGSL